MKTFQSADDFRTSLEQRIYTLSKTTGEDLQRLRRKVAFDRFLARIFFYPDSKFVLKGGYAMELRSKNARVKDLIDMVILFKLFSLNKEHLKKAIITVFKVREDYPIPHVLPDPPAEWLESFKELSQECKIKENLNQSFNIVQDLYQSAMKDLRII